MPDVLTGKGDKPFLTSWLLRTTVNRHKPSERFMFGCLLVALMVGIFALKFWMVSVEERLADNLAIHWDSVGTDRSQTNILEIHERRLRKVEQTSWVVWDGWPSQQQIARSK